MIDSKYHQRAFQGFSTEEILSEFQEASEVIVPKYPQSQEQGFEQRLDQSAGMMVKPKARNRKA